MDLNRVRQLAGLALMENDGSQKTTFLHHRAFYALSPRERKIITSIKSENDIKSSKFIGIHKEDNQLYLIMCEVNGVPLSFWEDEPNITLSGAIEYADESPRARKTLFQNIQYFIEIGVDMLSDMSRKNKEDLDLEEAWQKVSNLVAVANDLVSKGVLKLNVPNLRKALTPEMIKHINDEFDDNVKYTDRYNVISFVVGEKLGELIRHPQ